MRGARPAGAAARRAVTRAAADAEARKVRRFMGGLRFGRGGEAGQQKAAGFAAASWARGYHEKHEHHERGSGPTEHTDYTEE